MTSAAYADISIKAHCSNPSLLEEKLLSLGPKFLGEDFQTDTYFGVSRGKMKLREGNIERLLTHYLREEDQGGKMKTTVCLYEVDPAPETIQLHTSNLKKVGQVVKRRRIYLIENVKFHFDTLKNGGTFVELEAIDRNGLLGYDIISGQAEGYKSFLGIDDNDLLKRSYIDMLT